ncbi:hypothetical protein GGP57_002189 [Salinibacter ruber]|nr:hypothetical protein [Salinibacter ruber]MCS3714669.1 hypothetical protein [Salinibacter ruber]
MAESILGKHPEIVYWNEPSYVWKYGNAYRRSDVLKKEDATAEIVQVIRKRFSKFLARHEGRRFMEKTPANALRMPFVLDVLPNAQVIHVVRDGRDVALSASREWRGGGSQALDSREKRRAAWPKRVWKMMKDELDLTNRVQSPWDVIELPAYARRFWGFLRRQSMGASSVPWGPRFPGLKSIRKHYSLLETCALQWDLCIRHARNGCRRLPSSQYHEVRYERLIDTPQEKVVEIVDFLGIDATPSLIDDLTDAVVTRDLPEWRGTLSMRTLRPIEDLVASTLLEFGYSLSE